MVSSEISVQIFQTKSLSMWYTLYQWSRMTNIIYLIRADYIEDYTLHFGRFFNFIIVVVHSSYVWIDIYWKWNPNGFIRAIPWRTFNAIAQNSVKQR